MGRRQINEFELNVLFTAIGAGIWYLQDVEIALHTFITLKRDVKVRGSVSFEDGENLLNKHRRNSLGISLKIAREAQVLSQSLQERLKKFKEERNWLVHHVVYQRREDLYLDDTRYALIHRIQAFADEALKLQKLILDEIADFVTPQGVSKEWVIKNAHDYIKKLKGE